MPEVECLHDTVYIQCHVSIQCMCMVKVVESLETCDVTLLYVY